MTAPRAPAGMSGENAAALDAFATYLDVACAAHAQRVPARRRAVIRIRGRCVRRPPRAAAVDAVRRDAAWTRAVRAQPRANLSAWRAFYRFLIERDGYAQGRSVRRDQGAEVAAPPARRRCRPRKLPKLVAIASDDPLAMRDRALFELAYSSGLRLSELAQLDVAGCDLVTGEVRVFGKGSKERIVPVGAAARDALTRWLGVRGARAAPAEPAMFIGRYGRRLSPRAIQQRLGEWAIRQGLTAARPSAHAAPFVRVACPAIVGGSSRRAGDARSRIDCEHAGVYASRFPGARQGVRRRASAREAQAIEVAPAARIEDAIRPRKKGRRYAAPESLWRRGF